MTVTEFVANIDQLVALPEVCVHVNQMIDSPRFSAADIGEVISQDTDLSARLLRTVNSAMYGLPVPVETISRAVTVIGTRDLRDLAVMTAARQLFNGIPADLMNMTEYWHYAISTGAYARTLAKRCDVLHGERLFVMGVLHDIGRLAILQHLPEQARDILLIAERDDDLLSAAEQDVLGFDHAEVGHALVKQWGLPESIQQVVRYHHALEEVGDFGLETALVHIGCVVASGESWGHDLDDSIGRIHPVAWEITGLDRSEVEGVVEEASPQIVEMTTNVLAGGAQWSHPAGY